MKRFEDLVFTRHHAIPNEQKARAQLLSICPDFIGSKQAVITFDNGHSMSILFGKIFYSDGVNTYEAWCSVIDDAPRGYLTRQEVTDYMYEVQALKDK